MMSTKKAGNTRSRLEGNGSGMELIRGSTRSCVEGDGSEKESNVMVLSWTTGIVACMRLTSWLATTSPSIRKEVEVRLALLQQPLGQATRVRAQLLMTHQIILRTLQTCSRLSDSQQLTGRRSIQ